MTDIQISLRGEMFLFHRHIGVREVNHQPWRIVQRLQSRWDRTAHHDCNRRAALVVHDLHILDDSCGLFSSGNGCGLRDRGRRGSRRLRRSLRRGRRRGCWCFRRRIWLRGVCPRWRGSRLHSPQATPLLGLLDPLADRCGPRLLRGLIRLRGLRGRCCRRRRLGRRSRQLERRDRQQRQRK